MRKQDGSLLLITIYRRHVFFVSTHAFLSFCRLRIDISLSFSAKGKTKDAKSLARSLVSLSEVRKGKKRKSSSSLQRHLLGSEPLIVRKAPISSVEQRQKVWVGRNGECGFSEHVNICGGHTCSCSSGDLDCGF